MAVSTPGIGNRIAPPRFILFVLLLIAASAVGTSFLGARHGLMAPWASGKNGKEY